MANAELLSGIRSALQAAADPVRGSGVRRYLKSAMPLLGVRVPEVRSIVRRAARQSPPSSVDELKDAVLTLWRDARWREERYAAIDLTGLRPASGEMSMLPVYEEIIRDGAWWDLVDGIAPRLGALLRAHPEEVAAVLRRWSTDKDFWIRRAAITAQLGAKAATDRGLLAEVIEANLSDTGSFIRKAIGWALRSYSASDPEWVRRFVQEHGEQLSALSRREAMRKLR